MADIATEQQGIAEGLPDYLKPVMVFDDDATGKRVAWVEWEGVDWLFYKHPDGQWVSWRKVTEGDRAILDKARLGGIVDAHHSH